MPSRVTSPLLLAAIASLGVVALVGCTSTPSQEDVSAEVVTAQPAAGTAVIADADPVARSIATSAALFESAPTAVVAPSGDESIVALSGHVAAALGVPLLLAPATGGDGAGGSGPSAAPTESAPSDTTAPSATAPADTATALVAELERLHVASVIAVGDIGASALGSTEIIAAEPNRKSLSTLTGVDVPAGAREATVAQLAELPAPERRSSTATPTAGSLDPAPAPGAPVASTIAVSTDSPSDAASVATARAAGVPVVTVPTDAADPLRSPEAIAALHDAQATSTLLLGEAFSALPSPDWSVRAAATGAEFPGGGQHIFDDRLYVALYGAPDAPVLGVLGEQDVPATIARAQKVAASYDALTDRTVVPTLEVIATVAAGAEGDDGNYSNELPPERLEPYIEAAAAAGVYVVIDLQPGRTDFLTQAKLYESLLVKPNVGLALDPEWRLEPDERHLTQIGSVTAAEINSVSQWLAALVDRESLPPKMLVLHQFRLDMIQNRQDVDMSHPQLELLIHADGQGGQPDKQATWRALHQGAPAGMAWGWKNFYDEDAPMLTPEQTMREVAPEVDLVTYQ